MNTAWSPTRGEAAPLTLADLQAAIEVAAESRPDTYLCDAEEAEAMARDAAALGDA